MAQLEQKSRCLTNILVSQPQLDIACCDISITLIVFMNDPLQVQDKIYCQNRCCCICSVAKTLAQTELKNCNKTLVILLLLIELLCP